MTQTIEEKRDANNRRNKKYRARHKERLLARSRELYRVNGGKEKAKERNRQWRLENKPRADKIRNKSRERNPERDKYIRTAAHARRRKSDESISAGTVQMVYEDNIKKNGTLICSICDKTIKFGDDSLDHNVPISKGGTHDYCNLSVTHRRCNKEKHTKTIREYKEKLRA